jgi:Uma2 family endonuclease
MSQPLWSLDADDPRAPSQEVWDRMSPPEREQVVASLPTDMPLDLHPPEGDAHRKSKDRARDALDEFFRSVNRRVYVSSELVTYYPGEPRFCPDVLAVLDVEAHERDSWIVSKEGKGLDLVVEVHVAGSARKDLDRNVVRYARLGIPEYFVFDRPGARVLGYRLKPGSSSYERLIPQAGKLTSQVLGLDVVVESGQLRFYHGTAPLLFMDEVVSKLNGMLSDLIEARDSALKRAEEESRRAEEESRRAEEESRRAEEESRRAAVLGEELARVKAELDRLRQKF